MMTNTSGLEPLGRAVLVKMIELNEMKASTIVIPAHVRQASAVMETRAEVVAVGNTCWDDERATFLGISLWKKPRAKPGDKVIVTRMAGYIIQGPADEGLYRLVNDRDIFCKIKES